MQVPLTVLPFSMPIMAMLPALPEMELPLSVPLICVWPSPRPEMLPSGDMTILKVPLFPVRAAQWDYSAFFGVKVMVQVPFPSEPSS